MKTIRLSRAAFLPLAAFAFAACSRPAPEPKVAAAPPTPAAASVAPPAAAPAARTAAFKFANQTLTVPDGFTVELVAGPPLVDRPISVAFDEQGRLYATDSSGLSDKSDKQFELKPHRVVRLEDTDGDGRFDKSAVFAEHMMFPQGALFYEGSLYVAAPPHIWKLTDTDGDGVSDERVAWYDGKTLTGCANDLHGPYLGPEGWFYWTKGAFAEQRHTLPNGKSFVTRASHIFRSRPDGTGLEPVLTGGMDNPVGVTFTATGERFLSGTFFQIPAAGKRDGLIHAIYGGVYGKENAALAGHPRTGDLMPIVTHMGAAAPCGSMTYRSRGFGGDYQDNQFVCYFNLRKIVRHELVADGATFKTRDTDFVTSDSLDFRPTDVLEDADGSVLVVDTGGWYKICCPTSQLAKPDVLGGIYRIRKTGATRVEDPRGKKLPWGTLPPTDLAALLADERPEVVQRAIYLLGQRGAAGVTALMQKGLNSPSVAARRNAVWTLARIDDAAARAGVRRALNDGDTSVVQTALQVVSLWRDQHPNDRLTSLLAAGNPALVRAAAEAVGRIGGAWAIDGLLAAAGRLGETKFTATGSPENPADRALEHALIYALIEIGQRDPVLAHVKSAGNPRLVRVALVALDQMEGGKLAPDDVLPWLSSTVPILKQTAAWTVGHHPEWGGALASFYRARLTAKSQSDVERGELQGQLTQLAKATAIQELLATTVSDAGADRDARLLALRAMAASGLKETPAGWFPALVALLSGDDAALIRQAVATARDLPMPKTVPAALSAALVKVGRNAGVPADVRLDALAAAPGGLSAVEPDLFDFLCGHLDGKEPMLVRGAAASVLARAPLAPPQQLALTATMKTVGPLEAPKLLPAFEKAPGEALGLALIASLKGSAGLAGLRVSLLKPLFAKYPASVQQQGEGLFALLDADAARQTARVEELLAATKDGDIRRGQVVFHSDKAACSLCHTIGYRGGRLGPDLTNIGRIRTERDLLEGLVFPSASFVRGYEPFTIKTKRGEDLTGLIRKDTAEEVVLATGPETEQRVARADIQEVQPGAVSQMPPGLDAVLTKQELADLLAFLKSRS
ncbi:MAG: HEAT repeat domain-containing protein [Verrucomicrobia bacterium]|nr:HEAT repeat domain-containing protein [Verrucomicrobiota bacterium]